MANDYDVIVVGAGPGGYVTAIRAAQLGFRTAIVEKQHLGGICLNWGCIPTKALLRSAEIYHYMESASNYGLKADGVSFDTGAIVKRSRGVAQQLNGGVGHLLKKNKVDVLWGEAKITAPHKITVSEPDAAAKAQKPGAPKGAKGPGDYQAKHIIIATGARPRAIPGIEPDGETIWTYFEAMVPDKMPASILVMGSGAIGVEFASFYAQLGVEVTIVELLDQILPVEDPEIAAHARKRFEKQGIKITTGAKVTGVEKGKDGISVAIENGKGKPQSLTVERLISAVGVVGNTDGMGLEELGLKMDRGIIATDGYGRTNVEGIYAIGDVAGPPMLAHKAEHEGVVCIEAIAGLNNVHPIDKMKIPGCTYCNPQIASVGLNEKTAKEQGREVRIGRFPFIGNGKAIALGEPEGLVKTLFDKNTGELVGAHLIGAEVTELIQGFVVAMNCETTEEELMHSVFPHPTLSETMHESVLDAFDRVIHV